MPPDTENSECCLDGQHSDDTSHISQAIAFESNTIDGVALAGGVGAAAIREERKNEERNEL